MPTFMAMGAGVGHVAIYDGATDDPFYNPYGNLDALHFHTVLDYIGFNSATPLINTNVTVNGSGGFYQTLHTLGAHGIGGTPFVFGRCSIGGVWVPLAGTVPVVVFTSGESNLVCFSLAVSATTVYIAETRSFNSAGAFPSVAIPVQVFTSREVA